MVGNPGFYFKIRNEVDQSEYKLTYLIGEGQCKDGIFKVIHSNDTDGF